MGWMNPQEVMTAASNIESAGGSLQSLLNRMDTDYNQYASTWKGSSKEAYAASYADLRTRISNLISQASQITQQLRTTATNFSNADSGQTTDGTGLGSGGNLPGGGPFDPRRP
jgi:WXG100 family type VII secretion target